MAVPVDVYPGNPYPTHHIKLSKAGLTDMGLILCREDGTIDPLAFRYEPLPSSGIRMYQGTKEYSDEGELYLTTELDDWSLGRGTYTHHRNPGGYAESQFMYPMKEGELIRGGFPMYTDGIVIGDKMWARYKYTTGTGFTNTQQALDSSSASYEYLAIKFTTGATSYNLSSVHCQGYYVGNAGDMSVQLFSHNAVDDDPASFLHEIGTASDSDYDERVVNDIYIEDASPYTLASSTVYWLVFRSDYEPDASNYWAVMCASSTYSGPEERRVSYGVYWYSAFDYPYYRIAGPRDDYKAHLFEYKSALFAALEYLDGGKSNLYINGDQGMVSGTTGTVTTVDGLATWAADEAIGCIIKIVQGPGSEQPKNWRLITDNAATSSGTTAFTHDAWNQNPTTSSLVVVVAADRWEEIDTSTPWSGKIVYDVQVLNGIIYFAHGDGTAMTSLRFYNNSGSWDSDFNTSEVGQFTYLSDGADGDGAYLLGATGSYPSQFQISSALEDGTALTGATHTALAFETAVSVGDVGIRIRGLQRHGEYGQIYIFKENSVYQLIDRLPYLLQISEMTNTTDDRNGAAHTSHGVYLWFSWANTVLRYYNHSLDTKGPDRAEVGLPTNMQGSISALETYPGLVIASVDADDDGISSILAYNGLGWHEMYRAPSTGLRIMNMKIQSIPGENVDRLWFSCGSEMIWIPISIDPYNHKQMPYNFYTFNTYAQITTPYIYNSRRLIEKLFVKAESIMDSSSNYAGGISAFYRIDDDDDWTYFGSFGSYLNSDKALSSTYDQSGRRIQFLLQSFNGLNNYSFRLLSFAVHNLIKETKNRRLTLLCKVEDGLKDLQGNPPDEERAVNQFYDLAAFENNPEPVLVRSMSTQIDNKYFVIDENGIVPRRIDTKAEEYGNASYVVRISMYEIG